jgi:replicative DNA helicase
MAAIEYKVLAHILHDGLESALRAGLKAEQFKDPEAQSIYKFIERHYHDNRHRGELPLVEDIQDRWPSFDPDCIPPGEMGGMRTLIHSMQTSSCEADAWTEVRFFQESLESGENSKIIVDTMIDRLGRISGRYSEGGAQSFGISEIARHAEVAYRGALDGTAYGVPWPWMPLTLDTLGKKPEEFYVLYGRMKSMKTWILLKCAVDDFSLYNQRVMIWSKEMSQSGLKLRIASIIGEMDYQLLKLGRLPTAVRKRGFSKLIEVENLIVKGSREDEVRSTKGHDLIVLCGKDAPKTVEGLKSLVADMKPDVLYVDSFYHLDTPMFTKGMQLWNKITILAEQLKELSLIAKIPVIATAQANRKGEEVLGANMTEIAGSDAIGREADLVIRVIMKRGRNLDEEEYEGADQIDNESTVLGDPAPKRGRVPSKLVNRLDDRLEGVELEPPPQRKVSAVPSKIEIPDRNFAEIAMVCPGSREGVLDAFVITAIPGYRFDVKEESFTQEEVLDWLKTDLEGEVADAESKSKRGKGPRRSRGEFGNEPAIVGSVSQTYSANITALEEDDEAGEEEA